MASSRKRKQREPLSRERALRAAIARADREGIEAVTMRALAQDVGVEAMSLYHYVSTKDDLLDGMVDVVFAEIDVPDQTNPDWKATMKKRAHDVRAVLKRHPWALSLLESRVTPGLATLKHHDAVLGCLRRNGFSLVLTGHAYALLDAYIYGFVQQELSLPFETPDETQAVAGQIFQQMDPALFPHLIEYASQRVLKPGYSFGDEFDFGLELVVEGLDRARRAG